MSRSVEAVIYFPECHRETTVWVEEDIKAAILDEALSMIEISYYLVRDENGKIIWCRRF